MKITNIGGHGKINRSDELRVAFKALGRSNVLTARRSDAKLTPRQLFAALNSIGFPVLTPEIKNRQSVNRSMSIAHLQRCLKVVVGGLCRLLKAKSRGRARWAVCMAAGVP